MVGTGSWDGWNGVKPMLDKEVIGLRSITRASRYWGAAERLQISIEGMRQLALRKMKVLGRKMAVWISPGWPLLTGPQVELGAKQQEGDFCECGGDEYAAAPGAADWVCHDRWDRRIAICTNYYEEYLKGAERPEGMCTWRILSLQVLAVQSGGTGAW